MATTNYQSKALAELSTDLEAAALNARNLLKIASRELLEDAETGLSLIAAAERYLSDVLILNGRLCAMSAQILSISPLETTKPPGACDTGWPLTT